MSQIDDLIAQLENLRYKLEKSETTMHEIVEGDVNTVVITDSGKTHPSLEKWFNDNFASLYAALQDHVDDAETFAQLAQDIYNQVNGGIHYDGEWDASSGLFPPAPTEGDSLYKVSVAGTINTVEYKLGDYILYSSLTSSYELIRNGNNYLTVDGVAVSSQKLETPRLIQITGDASGQALFDGTSNVSINLSVSSPTSVDWSVVNNTPTTLAGYGITDGASINHNHDLTTLSDVTITSLASDDILVWDGAKFVNKSFTDAGLALSSHNHQISDVILLQDELDNKVNVGEKVVDSERLDGFDSTYFSPATHNHIFDTLANVTITNRTFNEIIRWDGSAWVNSTPQEANIIDNAKIAELNAINTGLFDGGELTINADNTTFDIAPLTGIIVDDDQFIDISFPGQTGVVTPFLETDPVTYVGIDENAQPYFSNSPFTEQERRNVLFLGVVVHSNNTNIEVINDLQIYSYQPYQQFLDFVNSEASFFNVIGNSFEKGTQPLTLSKTEGIAFKLHANSLLDPNAPHDLHLNSLTDFTFRYRLQNSTEFNDTTVVDPNNYDNEGVLTPVPLNKYTVQRFSIFPSNIVRSQYGQKIYDSMADAISDINNPDFVFEKNLLGNALLRGFLIIKEGTDDLSNNNFAQFLDSNPKGSKDRTVLPFNAYRNPIYHATSTGLLDGGVLSLNALSGTQIDITAGNGIIIDSTTDTNNPKVQEVYWDAIEGLEIINLTTADLTYILIDSDGEVVQQSTLPTPAQFRDLILLGVAIHVNRVTLEDVSHLPKLSYNESLNTSDLSFALGKINIKGNTFGANGANLFVNKSGGETYGQGFNYASSKKTPNNIISPALTAPDVYYIKRDAGGNTVFETPGPSIKPGFYDNGSGTLQAVNNNQWTIQRVYFYPESEGILVAYGQNVYNNDAQARSAIETEDFDLEIPLNSAVRAYIVIRGGATNLSLTSDAKFFNTDKFGGVSASSTLATGNLQTSYNNSIVPQITTSSLGAVTIQEGIDNNNDVLAIRNVSGTKTFGVKGNGIIFGDGSTISNVNAELFDGQDSPYYLDWDNFTNTPTTLTGYGITDAINVSEKGAANGVATLNASGYIPQSQLPALAITETFVVANETAQLALTAQTGDVAVRTDINTSYILQGSDPSVLANWQELLSPSDGVISVNGETGTVVLDTDLINEGSTNLYFTNARSRGSISAGGDLSYDSGTGVISFNETYSTPNEILNAIKTVDGTGSELDADLLDGQDSPYYLAWNNFTGTPTTLSGYGITDAVNVSGYNKANWDTAYSWGNWAIGVDKTFVDALGINAASLSGLQQSSFVRSDISDTLTGVYTFYTTTSGAPIRLRDNADNGTAAEVWLQFQQADGGQLGYLGFASPLTDNMYIFNGIGNIRLFHAGVEKFRTEAFGTRTLGDHIIDGKLDVGGVGTENDISSFVSSSSGNRGITLETTAVGGSAPFLSWLTQDGTAFRMRMTPSGDLALGTGFFNQLWTFAANGVLSGNGAGLTNVDAATLDGLDSTDFARLGTTTPHQSYLYATRGSTGAVAYFRQGSTGDIARFFTNATTGGTSGTSQVTITNDGGITTTAEVVAGSYVYANTGSGTLQMGAQNTSYVHLQTDRPLFYFNKGVSVDGTIKVYNTFTSIQGSATGTSQLAGRLMIEKSLNGGYDDGLGGGESWGANIWSMGDAFEGDTTGNAHTKGPTPYGLQWHRSTHANYNGDIGEGLYVYRGGVLAGGIGINGIYTVGEVTAASYDTSSDMRLKEFIANYDELDMLANLTAKWYVKNGKTELGYYAQEAEKYIPEATKKTKTERFDDEYHLNYQMVHTAKIAELENKVKKLTSLVEELLDAK